MINYTVSCWRNSKPNFEFKIDHLILNDLLYMNYIHNQNQTNQVNLDPPDAGFRTRATHIEKKNYTGSTQTEKVQVDGRR